MGLFRRLLEHRRMPAAPPSPAAAEAPLPRAEVRAAAIAPVEPVRSGASALPAAAPEAHIVEHVSAEQMAARHKRRNEFDKLVGWHDLLPEEKRTAKLEELKNKLVAAIDSDLDQQRYRVVYYLYQSALLAARRAG